MRRDRLARDREENLSAATRERESEEEDKSE